MRAHDPIERPSERDWISVRRDPETAIESVHAHFSGHAYDPHSHDEFLIGFTEQGIQQFHCHRALHTSVPGRAILIEPGVVHDGHAPQTDGFTYGMLNLPQTWLEHAAWKIGVPGVAGVTGLFSDTLVDNPMLIRSIYQAFLAIRNNESRLARDISLDALISALARHAVAPRQKDRVAVMPVLSRARDYLHANIATNIGLEDLASGVGVDRFYLSRQFQRAYGVAPHTYLVHLRLRAARRLLSAGQKPAQVALDVGFADQSHLGRWFRRAYGVTPAGYQKICTNVPD